MIKLRGLIISDTGKCYYRIKQPYVWISRHCPDINVRLLNRGTAGDGTIKQFVDECDAIVFNSIGGNAKALLALFYQALSAKKKVIYDIDDLDWEVPITNPAYDAVKSQGSEAYIKEYLKLASVVTVTTQRMANEVRNFNQNVKVFPNAIDYNYYYWNLPKKDDGWIRVGWTGGSAHLFDLKLIEGLGKWILDTFPNTKFVLGGWDARMISPQPNLLLFNEGKGNVWCEYKKLLFGDNYDLDRVEILRTQPLDLYPRLYKDIDISLVPMVNNKFNRSKSNLKILESSAYAIPCIASNVWEYRDTIISGINGFLSTVPNDWKRYLRLLIGDKELRQQMGQRLREDYKKKYDLTVVGNQRVEFIKKLCEG